MRASIEKLKQKPESYRHKFALLTSAGFTLAVFMVWASYQGYIAVPRPDSVVEYNSADAGSLSTGNQIAGVSEYNATNSAPSPLDNSKSMFESMFAEIGNTYNELTGSILDVLAPFVSGIEVYQSE